MPSDQPTRRSRNDPTPLEHPWQLQAICTNNRNNIFIKWNDNPLPLHHDSCPSTLSPLFHPVAPIRTALVTSCKLRAISATSSAAASASPAICSASPQAASAASTPGRRPRPSVEGRCLQEAGVDRHPQTFGFCVPLLCKSWGWKWLEADSDSVLATQAMNANSLH